jgi:hypothetical protein
LAHHCLVEIFCPNVHTLCHKIASIDMLLLHTALSFLETGHPFLLEAAGLTLLFCFPPML